MRSLRAEGLAINANKGCTVHESSGFYALSRPSTKSGMDAGITQAEARDTDKCARLASIHTFRRACTRAFERPRANNRETGSTTHTCQHRVRAKECA